MLFISAALLWSCADSELAGTAEQRNLGHAALEPGLEFRVSPGTVVGTTETSVEARAAAPLPTFRLTSGPAGADAVSVSLSNIHRAAELRVHSVRPLTLRSMSGCPEEADTSLISCTETPQAPACEAPSVERDSSRLAQVDLELAQPGCRETIYGFGLPDAQAARPLRIAVVGRTSSLDQLRDAIDQASADDPDLVVLLGDNAPNASLNGLRELDQVLRRADYPAVVLPGEDELVEGARAQFLETFGPFDYRFDLKGAHFVTFYSAEGELGQSGVERLDATLSRLSPTRPKLLFTHTPPIDPLGPRDEGFESQIEGARILSVLSDQDVDALFTGHINDAHARRVHGVQTLLTSVERVGEYLWVVVDGDGEVSVERRGL